jgi:hypothetical protein
MNRPHAIEAKLKETSKIAPKEPTEKVHFLRKFFWVVPFFK